MNALMIGIWPGCVVQSRPTNLPPEPELLAKELQKQANFFRPPTKVLYIENRREGPKVTYSWDTADYMSLTNDPTQATENDTMAW